MSPLGYYPSNCLGSSNRFEALDLWHGLVYVVAAEVDGAIYDPVAYLRDQVATAIEKGLP